MTMVTLLGTPVTSFASISEQIALITQKPSNPDNQGLTLQTIQSADKYVVVSGNRYRLSAAAAAKEFSTEQLIEINQSIEQANKNVVEQQLQIDAKTKTAQPIVELFAAYNTNYTTKNFWWGYCWNTI